MGNAVRTYSALNGGAGVVEYAHRLGLGVSVGAWLGPEYTPEGRAANQQEIEALIAIANSVPVESVVVGNEVLWRGDLSPQRLAEYLRQVRLGLNRKVPVATAEIASTLLLPENHPVVDAADMLLVNVYPYWSGVGVDEAAWYVADVFDATRRAIAKPMVIGATGWPSAGPSNNHAVPGTANATRFIADWKAVAGHEGIGYYYAAAFDEPWRQDGGVGAHGGIWDADRRPKYSTATLLGGAGTAAGGGSSSGSGAEKSGPVALASLPKRRSARASASASASASVLVEAVGPARARAGARDSLVLYRTWPAGTEYSPTGIMGDTQDLSMRDCEANGREASSDSAPVDHAISAEYRPSGGSLGWAGVYWQGPANNWGDRPGGGLDLRGLSSLSFYARGERGGEKITFFSGGLAGPYGDTLTRHAIDVTLTAGWRRYNIDLRGGDLSRVVGVFGWRANRDDNPTGARFYLDDIRLDRPSTGTQHDR